MKYKLFEEYTNKTDTSIVQIIQNKKEGMLPIAINYTDNIIYCVYGENGGYNNFKEIYVLESSDERLPKLVKAKYLFEQQPEYYYSEYRDRIEEVEKQSLESLPKQELHNIIIEILWNELVDEYLETSDLIVYIENLEEPIYFNVSWDIYPVATMIRACSKDDVEVVIDELDRNKPGGLKLLWKAIETAPNNVNKLGKFTPKFTRIVKRLEGSFDSFTIDKDTQRYILKSSVLKYWFREEWV